MPDYNHGRNLHVDAVLTNAVVGRKPEGYVADQLVPILGVNKQSNVYYKIDHMVYRRHDPGLTARAPGTEPRKVKFVVSSDTYYAKNYALGADWPVEDEANADEVIQFAQEHAELVTERLLMDYEARVAALANTTTAINSTTSVLTPWTAASATPYDDLINMAESFRAGTGVKPNVILYPEEVGVALRKHGQIRDLLFGDRGGIATDQQIANLLNIPKVLVPSILINSTSIGQTLAGSGALTGVWAKKVWMFHVKPMAGRKVDTWVQGFRWTNPLLGTPWAVQRFPFDPKTGVEAIAAQYYQDEKVISRDLAWAVDSVI